MTMPNSPTPPELAELFAQYLQHQAAAHEAGLASAELGGEVVPYEAVPVQTLDPRLAWDEALAAATYFHAPLAVANHAKPPDWPGLVCTQEPSLALPFCLGNFPQLVRNFSPLLHRDSLAIGRRITARPVAPALLDWANEQADTAEYPQVLLAAGVLRLARQFEAASDLLRRLRKDVPADWRAALANEEAALSWHRGRAEEAAEAWQTQADSVPVLFNRGLAALFLGRLPEARAVLNLAAAGLPEQSGWHHLARLYLAVAEMHA